MPVEGIVSVMLARTSVAMKCEKCDEFASVHLSEIRDGVHSSHHFCAAHAQSDAGLAVESMAEKDFNLGDPDQQDAIRQMMGPAQLDQHIRLAIQMCWMMLPSERRSADEVERQLRRVVDRAL